MIKHLKLKNFTVFKEADLEFSPRLNVIVGENGTGKTHLLKLGYLLSNAWKKGPDESINVYLSKRIRRVFATDKIGHLTTVKIYRRMRSTLLLNIYCLVLIGR